MRQFGAAQGLRGLGYGGSGHRVWSQGLQILSRDGQKPFIESKALNPKAQAIYKPVRDTQKLFNE